MKTTVASNITEKPHIVRSNIKVMIASIWICYSVFLLGHALHIGQPELFQKNNGNVPDRKKRSTQTSLTNFYNVIVQDGADPWVYKHTDGYYYMTHTTGGDVRIWRSRTFTSFDASYSQSIWSATGSGLACSDVWAPEIHFLNSGWYVYFAAKCYEYIDSHRMFVLENTNADPFNGSFTFKGQITDSTNYFAIDGTVYLHRSGQLYFIWSGWVGAAPSSQSLYIAEMSNPLNISSQRVLISTPTFAWEMVGGAAINEGPEVTVRNGVISLVYSASGSWTNDYCLGLITASTRSNLMNPASWTKRPDPIFSSTDTVFGPGHHSLTQSPDGQEDWIVYHSARFSGGGWNRQIRTQQFTWNADSTPNLGAPVDPNTPIQIPSGDPVRDRYEAEDTLLLNNPRIVIDNTASNNLKVGNIVYPNSTAIFTILCAKAGSYVIAIRTCNGSPGNATATQLVSVNSGYLNEYGVVYGGWSLWSTSMFSAYLSQGVNTLTIMKGSNSTEIDEIDVLISL